MTRRDYILLAEHLSRGYKSATTKYGAPVQVKKGYTDGYADAMLAVMAALEEDNPVPEGKESVGFNASRFFDACTK